MTIIEKIKRSVEAATGLPFLYHAVGEINELIARAESLPVAFAFLLDSGMIDDVNGRYHERVTLAVMFADKSQFDFNAIENEQIIDRMKIKAYKWLQSLRLSNDLNIVAINQTQRLYDATTDILTGFSVNVTIEDYAGYGECELPEVVFEIKANGEYDVVGIDKVLVNVLPQLEKLIITQNGEYLPSEGVAGFSKVTAKFDTSSLPKIKVREFAVTNDCIEEDGTWEGENLIDTRYCTNLDRIFEGCSKLQSIDTSNWDFSNVTRIQFGFYKCNNLQSIDTSNWDTSKLTIISYIFEHTYKLTMIDTTKWDCSKLTNANNAFGISGLISLIGNRTIDDVLSNNVSCLNGWNVNSIYVFRFTPNLDRASIRSFFNGLADLTGQDPKEIAFMEQVVERLTDEDIAIATNKNWTITSITK